MCGFAGFVDRAGVVGEPRAALSAMAARLVHRGPDDEGLDFDGPTRVGFAFRRLSIQDLSPAGHQPMASASGRFLMVFNGEVYNHAELRPGLSGHFRGHSDTETMLAAFEARGVEASLADFRGMFAFAVLDRRERALWLVRDRFGVKPLYLGLSGGRPIPPGDFEIPAGSSLVFGSELKAFRAMPGMSLSVDRGALALMLRYGYVPAPWSIHPEARKLPPGSWLRLDLDTGRAKQAVWWSAQAEARRGAAQPFRGGEAEAVEAVEAAVRESVQLRRVSDVPLGAFLSGGIDSSLVVAAMQSLSEQPVRTFTIGFGPKEFDEAPYARQVAAHLGTEHTERYVSGEEALAMVPRLATIWDEPFADSSQIPTLLISAVAREQVTVALSGDGGDELFGGYVRYQWTRAVGERARRLGPLRPLLRRALRKTPREGANRVFARLEPLLPPRLRLDRVGDRAHRLARLLENDDPWSLYRDLVSVNGDPLVLGAPQRAVALTDPAQLCPELPLESALMHADILSFLADEVLVKVDRASMAVSLEAREPLLDHKLAELAFSLPLSMKIRDGGGKWILREALARRVPRALFERPKRGFAVPLREWLQGPLREWGEALLAPDRLRREGWLDVDAARRIWTSTLDPRQGGTGNDAWALLSFQAWLEAQG